ncbi:MAG: peptidylprolyl isomerase [Acidobacteria bacterium]|nr:peptidylprolyl isomerase [Acidobacteriota bacterium]
MKCVFALALGACSLPLFAAADVLTVEEIIAKVNGDIVTRGEVEHARKLAEAELRQQGLSGRRLADNIENRSKDSLRDRIDQLLLVQKGKELNINVDGDVSKAMAAMQKRAGIADPEKFQQWVREQAGMPFEDYRNEMKNSMLTERVVRDEVGRRVQVKRDEMQKFYAEHKNEFVREERVFLRQIFVSTEGRDAAGVAAGEKKAKDLAARATKGEKFADLARDNSDDQQTAQSGGDMPPFPKGQLRPEIEGAVWDKPRGFVTPPIKVANGFLILRVEDHQKSGQATFEEVENEIMDKMFSPKMQPAVREYLTQLRKDAFLEIKPGFVDSGAAPGKDTSWTDPAQLRPETVSKKEVAQTPHRKRALWMVPVPGTITTKSGQSSSKN